MRLVAKPFGETRAAGGEYDCEGRITRSAIAFSRGQLLIARFLRTASLGPRSALAALVLALSLALPPASFLAGAEPLASAYVVGADVVASGATYTTIAGADRYATAAAVSRAAFPSGADTVVIANGQGWADAVSGGVLAGACDGPVLLVEGTGVPAVVRAEIARLAPSTIYILGGPKSLPDAVVEEVLEVAVDATATIRLAGEDRYGTSAKVASETIDAFPASWGGQALVASGYNYADALTGGPFAIATHRPVYLIDEAHAAQVIAAMQNAGVSKVAVLGGDAAVSPVTRAALATAFGAANIDRVAGATRYQTATILADLAVKYSGFSLASPGLATGEGFADALTAAPLLAMRRSPLLLAPRATVPDTYADWLYARRGLIHSFTAFGGDAALSAAIRQDIQLSLAAPRFDVSRAMTHVRAIAGFGARTAGGIREKQALDYVATQLASYGYAVGRQSVLIPGGVSGNVLAERRGTSSEVIVIGAHADSKAPSPGANDNASGVAAMLELARVLSQAPVTPTVRFIAFGAEEISGSSADDHHFGSRGYVAALSSAQKSSIAGMVSVDMVGYGDTFNVRSMGVGPKTLVYSLQGRAGYTGVYLPFLRDPGRYGWSDHEAFERQGIPVAWLEWREDPLYHTIGDTASHVDATRVDSTGRLLRGWVLSLSPAQVTALR